MSGRSEWQVPVVDISPYLEPGRGSERAAAAAEVDAAARTVGFIQILGHRVPDATLGAFRVAMDGFFDQPLEDKKAHLAPAGINRGYTAPKTESLSLSLGVESASRMNDFFEAFNIGSQASDHPELELPAGHYAENIWPRVPAGFETAVLAYFAQARRVAGTLTRIFADALHVPQEFFSSITDHSLDVLRMNNYALPEGEIELDGDLIGMGEHTDYGIVTVLWADDAPGLQVLGRDDAWHDVSPAPGALLINFGDLTTRLTNEQWMSTLHRVKPPVVDGRIMRRRSAAMFHDGNADAVIETLPTCLDERGGSNYEPITVADHIAAKLAGSRGGRANPNAAREAARVRRALELQG